MINHFPLPIQEEYVHGKFDDQRQGHDNSFHEDGMAGFWTRQIVQYLDRAHMFFEEASKCKDAERARLLEMKAQQAICKAMMTIKGCAESSIRVFGPLPRPGMSSTAGVEHWPTGAILLEREIEARNG